MKTSKLWVIALITLLIIGILALPAAAQSPVTAQVDRTQLSTDEALLLSVEVDSSAGRASQPSLPPLDGFQILGTSSGTSIRIVNGNMTSTAVYNYTLQPSKTGQLTIEPITVTVGGQSYTTQPITVEVSQGTGQVQPAPNPANPNFPNMPGFPNLNNLFQSVPGSRGSNPGSAQPLDPADAPTELVGQDFFVEAEVDKTNPYQGEQVIYTFRFYQAESLFDQPEYEGPSFTGFWSEEQNDNQVDYTIEAEGRTYRVTELRAVLFPTGVGEVTIEAARLTIPGDFFTRGQILQTQPVTLNVRPLPDNAPATFQGAVGQFNIVAQADKSQSEINDTVTLTVAITGNGNLENMADPIWTEGNEWRAFDSEATVSTQFNNDVYSGTRTYERLLVPTEAGDLLLPAIEFSFFNPQTESYETVSTEPIIVQVTGNVGAGIAPSVGAGSQATVPAATTSNVPQLRPNKPATALNAGSSISLVENGLYWLLWLVPVMLFAGYWGWGRYQQQRMETADSRRSASAAKRANQALHAARKEASTSSGQAAGSILITYMEEKMNQRVVGLSQTQLADLLQEHGVNGQLAARVQDALMQAEMSRYAPNGVHTADGQLLQETDAIIKELEKELK